MAEIITEEKTRFGKPVIKGTRLTVGKVLGACWWDELRRDQRRVQDKKERKYLLR
ncbi:MAG TPA: DUF433 domain-containing protein [Nitrososphaerales archaeon]|nr:DUF433 domain-containing protein [Nitrososphaerales archaeon]